MASSLRNPALHLIGSKGGGGIQVLTNTISVFMYTVRTFPKDFFVVVEMELIKL